MDSKHILLKLVLDEIQPGDINVEQFRFRKELQKKIYLVQITGIDLGHRYNWYFHGPYCPGLADDLFALKDELEYDEQYKSYKLNPQASRKVKKAEKLAQVPSDVTMDNVEWVELLASLHYLKHIAYWSGKGDPEFNEVFEKLVKSKPHFKGKRQAAETAWGQLDQAGLVRNKTVG